MSSLTNHTLKLTEKAYHEHQAWCYSQISKYAKEGFSAIATLHDRTTPTPSMAFGSLFDSILTKGKSTLDEYVIFDREVPAAEKKVIDYLIACDIIYNSLSSIPRGIIEHATAECEYYPKWGYDAKMKHLMEYDDYYGVAASKKKIVSKQDWDDAIEMAKAFRSDDYLNTLFGIKNTDKVEYIYQAKFLTSYTLPSGKTVDVKIMPDLIKIDHEAKTIQLVDLKTSTIPAWNFKENFLKFRYDLQAKIYSDILSIIIADDVTLSDYTVLPYLFTDISRADKIPVTFVYDQTAETQANGFTMTVSDKTYTYKSWQTLLDEILSYEEVQAKVPSYITLSGPNDILSIINNK